MQEAAQAKDDASGKGRHSKRALATVALGAACLTLAWLLLPAGDAARALDVSDGEAFAALDAIRSAKEPREKVRLAQDYLKGPNHAHRDRRRLLVLHELIEAHLTLREPQGASRHVDEALSLASGLDAGAPEIAALLCAKGRALVAEQRLQAAEGPLRACHEQALESGEPSLTFTAALGLFNIYNEWGEWERALRIATEMLDGALLADAGQRFGLLNNMGLMCVRMQDYPRGESYLRQALALEPRIERKPLLVSAFLNLAYLHSMSGDSDEQLRAIHEAERFVEAIGDPASRAKIYNAYSDLYQKRGDFTRGIAYATRAMTASSPEALPDDYWIAVGNLGACKGALGDQEAGIYHVVRALRHFERAREPGVQLQLYRELTLLYEARGDYRSALATERKSNALSRRTLESSRQRQLLVLQERFDARGKEQEIELLNVENALKQAQLEGEGLRVKLVAVTALGVVALAGLLLVRYGVLKRVSRNLKETNSKLNSLVLTDPLTGLYNRRFLQTMIGARASHALRERYAGSHLCDLHFLILDLDGFKGLNDTYGHGAGDAVLTALSTRLKQALRGSDTTLRWGGDEFMVVTQGQADQDAADLASKILSLAEDLDVTIAGESLRVTLSIGACRFPFVDQPASALAWEDCVALADAALYRAKRDGRNRTCFVKPEKDAMSDAELEEIRTDLARAEEHGLVSFWKRSGTAWLPLRRTAWSP